MPFQAPRPTLLTAYAPALALWLLLVPQGAQALSLGRPQVQSALGQPLDVTIPLTLAAGEQLTDACARAEVTAGEARVPAGLLQLRLEGEGAQQRLRLVSLVRVEEPALRITLALGCPLRLTREFNVFVDPPGDAAAAPAAPPAAALPPPPAPVSTAVLAAAAPLPQAAPAPAVRAPAVQPRARKRPKPSGPRLVLERPEVLVDAPAVQAAASAPAMEMTPELEAQIAALEQTVAQLRTELEARLRAEAASATASAASAPAPTTPPRVEAAGALDASERRSPYRDPMTWLTTLGLGLLAGAAAYQFSRWRDDRRRRELAYWRAMQAAEGGAVADAVPAPVVAPSPGIAPQVPLGASPLAEDSQHSVTRPQPRPMAWPPVASLLESPALAPMPPADATQPLPVRPMAAPELSQTLTVADELLDLRQQVDFLLLLGQHDAAADLLAAQLSRGAASAMPMLMLMEMCQQRGEGERFTELARAYEQQLGAPAPSWTQSLARGRSLDGCTSVIAHLQVVWAEPAAAMQMLQELIARGGGPGVQQFELPAYSDLLMLYAVARDLFEAGQRSDGVDFMLPLDSQFDSRG